jgi:(p)ppGpp synthase/HD superfamily hydrolase
VCGAQELSPRVMHMRAEERSEVHAGLRIAYDAHDGQLRKSGEPFITHPVAVACILGDMGMDVETIIAGLLHDTVEDTERVTFEGIEARFGPAVRRIVEGETKVSKVSSKVSKMGRDGFPAAPDVKADDLQQMFIAMTEEVRVIIVKLADRLHNMRTLESLAPHKRKRIADETLEVFAPLAKLLGMYQIKDELEAHAFRWSDPEAHAEMLRWFDELSVSQGPVVEQASAALRAAFARDEFLQLMCERVEVDVRCKELYSVHRKMRERGLTLQDVRDVAQIRVVAHLREPAQPARAVDAAAPAAGAAAAAAAPAARPPAARVTLSAMSTGTSVCYHVLGLVHAMWPPIPGRVKDYIATPKPNGYRALHTLVLPFGSNDLFPLELQIRTEEMHRTAECGIAADSAVMAHWHDSARVAAAGGGAAPDSAAAAAAAAAAGLSRDDMSRRVGWLQSIREWQQEFVSLSAREFVDTVTGDLLVSGKRVFVFTPKGEVLSLPRGATTVDYAYHIHTDVGNRMVAAKVNGVIVPPAHVLRNAEVVDIVTYNGAPSPKLYVLHATWVSQVHTRSTRHKLLKFLKDNEALREAAEALAAEALPPGGEPPVTPLTASGGGGGWSVLDRSLQMEWTQEATLGAPAAAPRTPSVGDAARDGGGGAAGTALAAAAAASVQDDALADTLAGAASGAPGGEQGAAYSMLNSLLMLRVECGDRNGLLADVSSIIARYGLSIRAYSGKPLDEGRGTCSMGFELGGDTRQVPQLIADLNSVTSVLRWQVYCTWRAPPGVGERAASASDAGA